MNPKITLEALEVLDAIDRRGSFAAAAASLYKVPSAITYTMHKLEEDIGVVLFRKEGRRSLLTPAGKVLLDQGRELLVAADKLVETTRQIESGWESCINITIDTSLDYQLILPLLKEFYQLRPDIEVNLHDHSLAGSLETVINDQSDLVIGATKPETQQGMLSFVEFYRSEWAFAVCKNHPLTNINRKLTTKDIREYRAVVVRDSTSELPALTKRLIDKQTILRVSSIQQKIDCQVEGLGVGYLPVHRINKELNKGLLIRLAVENEDVPAAQYLVWKKNNKGKALRWFIDKLKKGSKSYPF